MVPVDQRIAFAAPSHVKVGDRFSTQASPVKQPLVNRDCARGDRGLGSSLSVRYGCMMVSLDNN